jgi:hypothetical protein
MLFRETVVVYCENHTEHKDTLCGQNAVYINSVRTSQESHYASATKANRLMLFIVRTIQNTDNRFYSINERMLKRRKIFEKMK